MSTHYDFFFSSRRRHTRCGRDWSSDVCSSDLTPILGISGTPPPGAGRRAPPREPRRKRALRIGIPPGADDGVLYGGGGADEVGIGTSSSSSASPGRGGRGGGGGGGAAPMAGR